MVVVYLHPKTSLFFSIIHDIKVPNDINDCSPFFPLRENWIVAHGFPIDRGIAGVYINTS